MAITSRPTAIVPAARRSVRAKSSTPTFTVLTGAVIAAAVMACSSGDDQRVIVVPGWGPSAPAPAATADAGVTPAGSSTAGGGGSSTPPPAKDAGTSSASCLPSDVAALLATSCTTCHADPPIAGSLSGLVTYADLKATAKEDSSKNEAELSVARMQNAASPMPPGALPPASAVATLQNWITAGYPQGSCGGGTTGGTDSGTAPPPATGVVFTGAPAFSAQTGPSTHNAGLECMGCHGAGGSGPQFEFGGTLYDGSGNPLSGAEVRFVYANGSSDSAYTSATGTFYQPGTTFTGAAHVGVRNATSTQEMITALQPGAQSPASTGGACSACHCSGSGCTQPKIHLP
jgi:hypothetical protein